MASAWIAGSLMSLMLPMTLSMRSHTVAATLELHPLDIPPPGPGVEEGGGGEVPPKKWPDEELVHSSKISVTNKCVKHKTMQSTVINMYNQQH